MNDIYFVLIAVDRCRPNDPNVIGLYENRDEAYEDRNKLQSDENNFWDDYIVRSGIVIHDKKGN